MTLYELTREQVEALTHIIDNAQIPGRAAALVAGIQAALREPAWDVQDHPREDEQA